MHGIKIHGYRLLGILVTKRYSVTWADIQADMLLIESSTASVEELSQFQNWIATFLTKELADSVKCIVFPPTDKEKTLS